MPFHNSINSPAEWVRIASSEEYSCLDRALVSRLAYSSMVKIKELISNKRFKQIQITAPRYIAGIGYLDTYNAGYALLMNLSQLVLTMSADSCYKEKAIAANKIHSLVHSQELGMLLMQFCSQAPTMTMEKAKDYMRKWGSALRNVHIDDIHTLKTYSFGPENDSDFIPFSFLCISRRTTLLIVSVTTDGRVESKSITLSGDYHLPSSINTCKSMIVFDPKIGCYLYEIYALSEQLKEEVLGYKTSRIRFCCVLALVK